MKGLKLIMIAIVIVTSGCRSTYNHTSLITGQEWLLKSLSEHGNIVANPQQLPTLNFRDNNISGFAGCNRYFGTYSVPKKGEIVLKLGGTTRMACPDMKFEGQYLKALSEIDRYSVANNELTLRGNDRILVYSRQKLIGVANDQHGCNAAAGYIWSEVRKDCIRLFDSGVRMSSVDSKEAGISTFIVFSADSLKAEVFRPNNTQNPILDRHKLPNGGYAWNQADDDTLNVRQINGRWVIEKRGRVLYRQDIKK